MVRNSGPTEGLLLHRSSIKPEATQFLRGSSRASLGVEPVRTTASRTRPPMFRPSLRFGAAVLVLLIGATSATAGEPSPVATEYDLVYSKPGEVELKLDIARPSEGPGPFPAVLVIHGGAWRAGKKDDLRGALGEF